ncbi:MAG TPA: SH3 domain-containing protein [Acidimicrobiia bacterium]|nr:SH3 domain-containing protein [Acidimicrobiia bacterium]
MRTSVTRYLIMSLVLLVIAACGGSGADTTTTSPATSTTQASTASTTTSTAPTTTTSEDDLPGEPIDFGPAAGDEVAVVGVAHDDVLNVRAAPGTDSAVVAELEPTATGLIGTGRARSLPQSIWFEVEVEGVTGWVSSAFVGYLGLTDDATAEVIETLGETPGAETMMDLGLIVAEAMSSEEPPSRIVMSVAPTVGDLGEVTYDVVGLGDDALGGVRLHVFGDPAGGGEGFVLPNVERTFICSRGVTDDGFCL